MKRSIGNQAFRCVVIALLAGTAACGGGGSGGDGGGGGEGGGADRDPPVAPGAPRLLFFNVSPTTVPASSQFTVSWTLDPQTVPTGFYTAEFHVNREPKLIEGLPAMTLVFSRSGGLSGGLGLDVDLLVERTRIGGHDFLALGASSFALSTRYARPYPKLYGMVKVCAAGTDGKNRCTTTVGEAAVELVFPNP